MIIVGHTKVRCKQPPADTDGGMGEDNGGFGDNGTAGGGEFDAAPTVGGEEDWGVAPAGNEENWEAAPAGGNDWESSAAPTATAGGW